jgi:hypothetical protein
LIRAALCRAQFKLNKNPIKNSNKLLCLTANLASRFSFSSSSSPPPLSISFNGLKQAGKYREHILHGLWNYQLLNIKSQQTFNQSSSSCSICYFFQANKNHGNQSSASSVRSLLISEISEYSNELLQCSSCHISVHRECYESVCLAINAEISEENDRWLCQQCALKKQVKRIFLKSLFKAQKFVFLSLFQILLMIVVLLVYFVVVFFFILIHPLHLFMQFVQYIKLIHPPLHQIPVIIVGHFLH